jgi:hypothetical protein
VCGNRFALNSEETPIVLPDLQEKRALRAGCTELAKARIRRIIRAKTTMLITSWGAAKMARPYFRIYKT